MRNSDPVTFFPGAQADYSVRQMIDQNYQDSITNLQAQWIQADYDQRTYLGDPDVWNTLFPPTGNFRRKMFSFNLTHSTIQVPAGYQRRNRKSTICIPIKAGNQKTSDQFTKCLYHIHDKNGYQVYSDAFENGALVQGFGLISIFPDYSSDPISPDIKLRYVDFKSLIIDPFFRQKDLSDCKYIWTRQYFSKDEAKLMYPKHEYEIEQIPTSGSPQDDKFYFMPENFGLQRINLLAFDEYWYLCTREATYAVDIQTQETKEIFGDEEDIRIIMMQLKDRIKLVKQAKQSVKRVILINGRVFQEEERPYGIDRYSYVGVYGNFNPDTPYYGYKFKGLVRDMRDAQYLFNRRKVTDLDILESQQQGIKVKKGALITPDDSLNRGNGRVLVISDKFDMNDVQPMEIIPPSPVMLQMEDMLKGVMREISGVNEELLGAAQDDKAGILSVLRQGAGLTTLQKYFDQLDQTQKECGDVIIGMIQHFWTYGKVKQVIGEEPTQEFDDKAFFEYGSKVVLGALTETQNQQELVQLLELQQRFGEIFPPEEIVEAMTIQNKDRIVQKMQKAQQTKAQQEQQMQQLQMQQMQVDNQTKISFAKAEEAKVVERIANAENERAMAVEKINSAHKQDTESLLNLAKLITELQGLDLNNLEKRINLLKSLDDSIKENVIEETAEI
jgi:hypothetical protein